MGDILNARDVPWQIWVVVVFLSVIGTAELLGLPMPQGLVSFGIKCVAVVGLIRGWRLVFVVLLILFAVDALSAAGSSPFIPFLIFAMMLLVASAHRHFFPRTASNSSAT